MALYIIPEIKREDEEQLSIEELTQNVGKVEDVVDENTQNIDSSLMKTSEEEQKQKQKEIEEMLKQLKESNEKILT